MAGDPFEIEYDVEADGRIIADIEAVPGALAYGRTREEAARNAVAIALEIIADEIKHGELEPEAVSFYFEKPAHHA